MSSAPMPGFVVFAKDVTRLAAFYAGVFGLRAGTAEPGLAVLHADGFMLVIHGIPETIAARIEITSPPAVRSDTPFKLFLPVDSLAGAGEAAAALGGTLWPQERAWDGPGFRACDGHDPEGNVFQAREPA